MSSQPSGVESKKEYHHGDLRRQLLEAVRELIEENGPEGFSVAQACRRAGVSTAAPYKHFKDRHEIMRGVLLLAMERMRQVMQDAADAWPAGDPSRIVALGQAYVDFARNEPGMFQMMFGHSGRHDQSPELEAAGERTGAVVKIVVAEHFNRPVDDPVVQLRAYAAWSFVHGHSFLCLDNKIPFEMPAETEHALLVLVGKAILPDPSAHAGQDHGGG
ncbi:TetR/AcrR family transcriptional regulator [Roseobacter sp.]|uniref:TetR/AcrR family transcriptional regulator n=1 Tax=Roseobacter sp. TaxID=1907202 RepID=UPI0025E7D7BB|nr:TetR/AcrR family transcriptional regulator [Roseobacter sp.]